MWTILPQVQIKEIMQMSDSSQAVATPEAAPQPKSFTQRFQEMEQLLSQMQYVVQFHSNVIETFVSEFKRQSDTVSAIKETVNGILKLADEGSSLSTTALVNKITQLQAESYRGVIEKDLAEGKIGLIDQAANESTIVAFSTADIVYGYKPVGAFTDETVKAGLLAGAKTGDQIGDITVLGLYEIIPTAPIGEPSEQPQAQV